jgi:hypothetical protein
MPRKHHRKTDKKSHVNAHGFQNDGAKLSNAPEHDISADSQSTGGVHHTAVNIPSQSTAIHSENKDSDESLDESSDGLSDGSLDHEAGAEKQHNKAPHENNINDYINKTDPECCGMRLQKNLHIGAAFFHILLLVFIVSAMTEDPPDSYRTWSTTTEGGYNLTEIQRQEECSHTIFSEVFDPSSEYWNNSLAETLRVTNGQWAGAVRNDNHSNCFNRLGTMPVTDSDNNVASDNRTNLIDAAMWFTVFTCLAHIFKFLLIHFMIPEEKIVFPLHPNRIHLISRISSYVSMIRWVEYAITSGIMIHIIAYIMNFRRQEELNVFVLIQVMICVFGGLLVEVVYFVRTVQPPGAGVYSEVFGDIVGSNNNRTIRDVQTGSVPPVAEGEKEEKGQFLSTDGHAAEGGSVARTDYSWWWMLLYAMALVGFVVAWVLFISLWALFAERNRETVDIIQVFIETNTSSWQRGNSNSNFKPEDLQRIITFTFVSQLVCFTLFGFVSFGVLVAYMFYLFKKDKNREALRNFQGCYNAGSFSYILLSFTAKALLIIAGVMAFLAEENLLSDDEFLSTKLPGALAAGYITTITFSVMILIFYNYGTNCHFCWQSQSIICAGQCCSRTNCCLQNQKTYQEKRIRVKEVESSLTNN